VGSREIPSQNNRSAFTRSPGALPAIIAAFKAPAEEAISQSGRGPPPSANPA